MLYHVSRTCTFTTDEFKTESKSIEQFRELDAYVLLGNPGAGKTSLFKQEAKTSGGIYLTARDFLTFNRLDEWREKLLFIDGLDETRAGKDDGRTPLDAIRGKLELLGRPRFRLSCREADWLGSNDRNALDASAPSGKIAVLHLDALSTDDIKLILAQDTRVENADNFIQKATQLGLEGLLNNPQTLDMLIEAVQEKGSWPETKLETYQLACRKLALEPNSEHSAPYARQSNTTEQILDAAGFLYAIQLLANASVFSLDNDTSEGKICLNTLQIPTGLSCNQAVKSRLFKAVNENQFEPIHRSVAEFLGARYLANRMKAGLPLGRILALMTGFDGGVVAALRGLMAWLSAHSTEARDHLIEIDSLGVVLYGDAQLFSTDAKKHLLSALQHEAEKSGYLRYDYWATHSFAALTTKDMAEQLLILLKSPLHSKPEQIILNCIMDGLSSSESIPELKDALIAIVCDNTYREGVRVGALEAFMHQYPNDIDNLLTFAKDLKTNRIKDESNRLLGLLLPKLYSNKIKASEVFEYLKYPSDPQTISNYDMFWKHELVKLVEDQDIPILLDELVSRGADFLQLTPVSDLFEMAGQLLVRGLKVSGATVANERLYDWLSLGLDKYSHSHLEDELPNEIRAWIESEPERYLSILAIGLSRITDPEKVGYGIYEAYARLYNATVPENIGHWWLERSLAANDCKFKNEYFIRAFWTLSSDRGNLGLSLEFFEKWIEKHSEFHDIYEEVRVSKIEDWRHEHAQSSKEWALKHKQEKLSRLAQFREHISAMQDGSAYPQLFSHIAYAYFGHYSGIGGKSCPERLSDFLGNEEGLVNAARNGLRKIIYRTDLPQTSEIFALASKNREHYIRLPFLTCLAELYNENPAILDTLSDDLASKALAFWYTYGAGNELAWVKPLSFSRAALAGQVIIEYVSAMLAAKVQHIYGLYQLAHDPKYHEIARLAAIPLLKIYPIRGIKQQTSSLEYILKAAIEYSDKLELLKLVTEKLVLKSMDIAQRVYWLATGLILAPAQYESEVSAYVSANVTRINYLSAFLYDGWRSDRLGYPSLPTTIGLIVELLAPRCTPHWPRGGGFVTRAMNEGDYVRALIGRLGENPDEESTKIIASLLLLPQLSTWHGYLQSAQQTQQISRREALFQHPSADEIAQTLNNLKPANVADLSALTLDYLNTLSREIRTSNTDSYKQFWNVDGYNKTIKPRNENSCRDILVDRAKPFFQQLDIEVLPESHEANDKEADICLSFHSNGKSFHLPVEVKLDHSKDLWSAIHKQLIPLYTLDPETQARGVFLVFWFNSTYMPAPPSGKKPQSAAGLRAMLIESLTPEEQLLINIFVLDVTSQTT